MVSQTTTARSSFTLTSHIEKDKSVYVGPIQTSGQQLNENQNDTPVAEGEDNFIGWHGLDDPENRFNFPIAKKWRVTLLACFMTFVVQINGTMMTSAWEQINESFHISDEVFPHSYWPVLSWNLGGAAAPLIGLPLMENFGVRWSYLVRKYYIGSFPNIR